MIKPLTSLRFIFAFIVFASHSAFLVKSDPSLGWVYSSMLIDSMAGVTFFFVLSGFILAKAYGERLNKGLISRKEFILKRVARIYPLHLATLLLYLPYFFYSMVTNNEAMEQWTLLKKFLINALLLQSFFPQMDVYFSFNEPSWSISNEMFFYVLFPLLVPFFFNYRKMGIGLMVAVCTALVTGMTLLDTAQDHYLFYINPFVRLVDFVVGICLYVLIRNMRFNVSGFVATTIELSAVVLLIASLLLHNYFPVVYRYSIYYWPPVILLIVVFFFQRGRVSSILSQRWLVFLGNISFGFYLLHWQIIRYVAGVNNKLSLLDNTLMLVLLMLGLTLLCSAVSFLYFEKPIVKMANKGLRQWYLSKKRKPLRSPV